MGVLAKTRAYTIGHMEYADGRGWRNIVKSVLVPRGITIFDPYHKPFINTIKEDEETREQLAKWKAEGRFDDVAEVVREIRCPDLRLCDISDFIIGEIDPAIPSWGTAEEFYNSNRMKKPIYLSIIGGKSKCPGWIFGTIPHAYIFDNIEEVCRQIIAIDDGLVVPDPVRWRLLKPEYR